MPGKPGHRPLEGLLPGRPSLYFFDDLLVRVDQGLEMDGQPTSILGELPGYEWEEPKAGRNAKEEPKKVRDHAWDALRYALFSHAKSNIRPEAVIGLAQ